MAADERNLNDEPRERQVGRDLGQECRDAVAAAATAQALRPPCSNCCSTTAAPAAAHPTVRASTCSARDSESSEMASRPPTPSSDASNSACSPTRCRRSRSSTIPVQPASVTALTSTSCSEPTSSTMAAGHRGPQGAAETGAAADEAEQTLRLARVEDVVRQRPELADQENAQDQAEEVEGDRDPRGRRSATAPRRPRAGRRWLPA